MGKFYDMINDFHESSKKWDPITHYTLDWTHDASTKSVGEMGRALGWDHLTDMANKDKADFGRWGGNTLGAAAAIYGGMSALGGSAGGAASGGAAGGGASGAGGAAGGATTGGFASGESLGVLAGDAGSGMGAGFGGDGMLLSYSDNPGVAALGGSGTGSLGGSWYSQIMDAMGGMDPSSMTSSQGGSGGGQQQSAAPQPGGQQQPNMNGNPALSEALARLVSEQEQTKRQQSNPFLAAMSQQSQQPFAPQPSRFTRSMNQFNTGEPYGRTY